MPRSPRAYLKPYAQQHQHMPLPSMYQDHHIPSQDMCLNQVPTCTMYQPCINHVPNQPCTINKCINHAPTPVPNHVHQPCTSTCTKHVHQPCTMINHQPCTKPCNTSTMYINTNHVPYHVSTMHHNKCLNHIPYHAIHHMPINQDMNQQCISPSRPQPTCTMHPMMCLKS
jgi:hypothetical protein